ncbi:MAG: sulfatase-like hydrolase/transferase, partial [Verrucomicrobiota bacterium]
FLLRLEELGLDENTVVIFQSDNGPNPSNGPGERFTVSDWAKRNPSQWRGNKTHTWENGIRSPCFIRWPGSFPPREVSVPSSVTDVFPTVLDLAGIDHESAHPLDGTSLVPLLTDDPSREEEREALTDRYTFASHQAVQFRNWANQKYPFPDRYRETIRFQDQSLVCFHKRFKLVRQSSRTSYLPFRFSPTPKASEDGWVLMDLENDPREQENVIEAHPEVAAKMQDALREWFSGIVQEKNFGSRPEFLIGYGQKESATIPVRCASRIGGTFTNVSPTFREEGDYGEFQLVTHTPGGGEVSLAHAMAKGNGELHISIGGQSHTIQPTGTRTKVGEFLLPEAGEELTLRVEAVRQGEGPILARLGTVSFQWKRQNAAGEGGNAAEPGANPSEVPRGGENEVR